MLDSIIDAAKKEVGGVASKKKTKKTSPKKTTKKAAKKTIKKKRTAKAKKGAAPKAKKAETVPSPAPASQSDDLLPVQTTKDELFQNFLKATDMKLSPKEQQQLSDEFEKLKRSYVGIVKQCTPEACNHRNICPFTAINRFPVNRPCPVETAIADHAASEYYKLLEEELHTDNFNIVEMTTVNSLIAVEVEEFRARSFSGNEGMIIDQPAFVINRTGQVMYHRTENPVYNVMERLSRRKFRLLQRLLLTPEAKARFRIDASKDRQDRSKEILARVEEKILQIRSDNADGTKSSESE